MNADGSAQKRLTKNPEPVYEATFSPDSKKIAFMSYRNGNTEAEIYKMKAKPEGKKNRPRNLTKNAASDGNPVFSPDAPRLPS